MERFSVLQWNVCSIKTRKIYLETLLFSNKIQIALLSETWLKTQEPFNIKGYDIIRCDRQDGYGGSCILIKNGIKYSNIDCSRYFNQKLQIYAAKILVYDKYITFVSIYASPNHNINMITWSYIFTEITEPYIIGGDFNAHHICWGSEITDHNGEQIIDVFRFIHNHLK